MVEQQEEKKIGFKTVQLLKHETLGIGSYGKVYKAVCDGQLLCAAKVIHETLFHPDAKVCPNDHEHRQPMRRFEQECNFLSTIRHPNVIQYLGMYQDPDTKLPVLLMELMDNNLTHFLENSLRPIPYHIQVNVCHDIILALSFLHSNGIVHRDLSSNNVLMIGIIRAKVTDFGMAQLGDLSSQATFTTCPGTAVYMPPEALKDKPIYTEKIDCFSFGVIAVQVITRLFPNPGDQRKEIMTENEGLVEKLISECERRQDHISKVRSSHPILPIALGCLKDKDMERPSAQEICTSIATLKQTAEYVDSKKAVTEDLPKHKVELPQLESIHSASQFPVKRYEEAIKQKDMAIAARLQEIQKLKEAAQIRDEKNDREFEELKRHLARAERRIKELELQLATEDRPKPQHSRSSSETTVNIRLKWRKGKKAPHMMSRNFFSMVDVTVDGDIVYMMENHHVYSYNASTSSWSHLPDCTFRSCPSAIVNNLFTLIGGVRGDIITNKLFSLTKKGKDLRWTEEFPQPMPTTRWGTSALCAGTSLIVAGGIGTTGYSIATTEVMNTETYQWSTAVDLPHPVHYGSLLLVNDNRIYMLGSLNQAGKPIMSVYTCSLNALHQTCSSKSRLARTLSLSNRSDRDVWIRVTDIPVTHSAYVCIHNRLLAIGGLQSDEKTTSAIQMYDPSTKSWEVISYMGMPRQSCYAAVLPDNQLIVIGGKTQMYGKETEAVEIATTL